MFKLKSLIILIIFCMFLLLACGEEEINQYSPTSSQFERVTYVFAGWGNIICDTTVVDISKFSSDNLVYKILYFNGPRSYGHGLTIDSTNGVWCYDIAIDSAYLGQFDLAIEISEKPGTGTSGNSFVPDTSIYQINIIGLAITIEKVYDQLQGRNSVISIFIDSSYMPDSIPYNLIGGFDFLITYDTAILTPVSVEPGELIADSDKWEYLTYQFIDSCGINCPGKFIRIVGLRETNNGTTNASYITKSGELFKIKFYVTGYYHYMGEFAPVEFYWGDCGDNVISSTDGKILLMGQDVYTDEGNSIYNTSEFGLTGPMDSCFETSNLESTSPDLLSIGSIIYRDGGIDVLGIIDIDGIGDINLNGIANEIADYVVMANYFVCGNMAYAINYEAQLAASEINGDNQVNVADLVYFARILIGDAIPTPQENPSEWVEFTQTGKNISIETNADVGGILLLFDEPVSPSLDMDADFMDIMTCGNVSGDRVLIYSLEANEYISSGGLIRINNNANLISVEASAYRGVMIQATIDIIDSCPIGDINLNDTAYEIADAVVLTNYFIYGEAALILNPECQLSASDVNGDGIVGIGDLIYLIHIIVGDEIPQQENPDALAKFMQIGKKLSIKTNVKVYGVMLVFDEPVIPTLEDDASHMGMITSEGSSISRLLIWSTDVNRYISTGDLIRIDNRARLISVEAADYSGTSIQAVIR